MPAPGIAAAWEFLSPEPRTVRSMGLSRRVVRIELTTRTAGPADRIALPGMQLWEVSWAERDHLGRERTWSAPHVSERGARRMVTSLLDQLAPGLDSQDAFVDHTT